MAKTIELSEEEIRELRKLAKAQKAAEEATEIRKRWKGFIDDNEDALRDNIEIDGLLVGLKISKQLQVKEV